MKARTAPLWLLLALALPMALPAQPVPTSLQGLHLELRRADSNQVAVHHYFWTDGRHCEGLPSGGLPQEPADPALIAPGLRCDRYSLSEGLVHLQGPAGKTTRSLVARSDGRLELDGHPFIKLQALPDAAGLAGTYAALVVGSQTQRQVYVFQPDGRFRFSATPMTSEDGSPIAYEGQFRTQGQLLELSGAATGALQRLTAYPYPGGGLMIDGVVFTR